ncbi:hypothetical protein SteCoe_314 [Stentor coeruleus]|uniref:Kelch motif family protein n=1 Tax=Stentor coeruleus TaxID=5963 RepID=A0A1R2D4J6_9CILI|nr:hypothetical protein SteCoe_314 [Stentor coeruleus]
MEQKSFVYVLIGDTVVLVNKQGKRQKVKTGIFRCELSVYNGKILYSGGLKNSVLSADIGIFDAKENWEDWVLYDEAVSIIGKLSNPRINHTQTIYKDFLYVIGGSAPKNPMDACEKIDLNTGKSFILPNIPFYCMLHGATLLNNRIYLLGGTQIEINRAREIEKKHLVYLDLDRETWVQTCDSPSKALRPCLIPIKNQFILIMGGWAKESQIINKVHVVDTLNSSIIPITDLNICEVFYSYSCQNNLIQTIDYVGTVHNFHKPSIEKLLTFEIISKKVWKRRRCCVFTFSKLKGFKSKSNFFSLPETIVRELIRFL